MTERLAVHPYGRLAEPATLVIERLLPGPASRIWAYLIDADKRRKWLADGAMEQKAGATFELVWRNDELTEPPGARPDGFAEEMRMTSRVLELQAEKRLVFTWGESGEVSFDLRPEGDAVLLTVTHRRITDRANLLMVGAGWHMHLDILAATLSGGRAEPFWDGWLRLKGEYDRRLPA
ncbi:SRPBCC family protein [Rhizobium sp. G187]|uniref:SRPBCC family protein n=1 Tax=unclassified Rhizobium TaxID=2613769 RepID=UPI0006B950CF|nr:SRPBCC family protein [Rhizobium sp. AAP43]KPF41836.1 ATPase [Rhizobium sp. AAP43]